MYPDFAASAAKGAQEMAEAQQRGYEAAIQKLQSMGATRELAAYILALEERIRRLEAAKK